MKNKVLVNLFDIHNQGSLLAIDQLKPAKVIYILNNQSNKIYKEVQLYEKNIYSKLIFESNLIEDGDILGIKKVLDNLSTEDTIINVTGGSRINSLILLNESLKKGFRTIYVDILNKQWYEFGNNMNKSHNEFKDISLENMLNLTGADLVMDSTVLSEKEDIIDITKKIYENLELWYKYKQKLYDNRVFIHDCYNNNKIYIKLCNLNNDEKNILKICLFYLNQKEYIKYKYIGDEVEVVFLKEYLRGFIFKSGTWLEVLTNIVVREITEVDEVKSGVTFLWKECNNRVRNELDVLAIKDSIFICISCKDSEKYDEDALNELEVYSKRLGGNSAKKILVATKLPCKQCVVERAKAMGINLVILDKDICRFKNLIKQIISQ